MMWRRPIGRPQPRRAWSRGSAARFAAGSPADRVVAFTAVEELSLSEVADILEIDKNTAKVHLSLARKRMREQADKTACRSETGSESPTEKHVERKERVRYDEIGLQELPCDLLDEFLGGELTVAERRAFEDHLPECPSCRDAVADWQHLRDAAVGDSAA